MATPTPTPTITVLTSLFEADGSTLATTFTETLVDFTSTAASIVDGATRTSSASPNPLLELLPSFSRSLVVQLIVLAAVVILHIVLMLHLAFTTRYHLPLAKVNYILLASGCVTSFVSVFWQLLEISIDARRRAREWPFMFDYLEFVFPGATWSAVKSAAWLTLNALTVILSHGAHIQMLTLLYPSSLEVRSILALLLPLAVISCVMSFSPLLKSQREQDIFDSGAAVCNSTLTLLYTCALSFWGLYIARKRAWGQSDASGSTAVFGGCALGMAILGSALSFVSVRRGEEAIGGDGGWLVKVTWLVLLWQTWFSVWWWIGAGMYESEKPLDVDDDERQQAEERSATTSSSIRRFVDDGIEGLRRRRNRNRKGKSSAGRQDEGNGEEIEMSSIQARDGRLPPHLADASSSTSSTAMSTPPTFLASLFRSIRKAHTSAAKRAHINMLATASENPTMNDAMIGRRGKGWSVGGILKSRQNDVLRRTAGAGDRTAEYPGAGMDIRQDRLLGAQRLPDDVDEWQDLDVYPPRDGTQRESRQAQQQSPPQPVVSKRFQNWRRRDVTTYD